MYYVRFQILSNNLHLKSQQKIKIIIIIILILLGKLFEDEIFNGKISSFLKCLLIRKFQFQSLLRIHLHLSKFNKKRTKYLQTLTYIFKYNNRFYFTHFSRVSIADFEQINFCLVARTYLIYLQSLY